MGVQPKNKPIKQEQFKYIGNIDLENRPLVYNEDGSISTVKTMGVNIDNEEVLIPTISPEGKVLSNEEAIKLYKETGQHLGKYKTVEESNYAAEEIHKQQEEYIKRKQKKLNPVRRKKK